jgi:ABC-type phosphate transport system substrate-binding protein
MRIKTTLVLIAVAIASSFIFAGHPAKAGDVIIICNKSVPEDALSRDMIKNIFLGKKTKWSNRNKIIFVTQKKNDVHKSFLKTYVSKTTSQFRNYWKKQVFTGKGRTPKSFPGDSKIIEFVAGTKGAIGYVAAGSKTDTVKLIADK